MRNGHYPLPPLRPELQVALDEMNNQDGYFAYAVCRTHDGQAWEVTTRQGGMYAALDGRYLDHDEAMAAGVDWLLEKLGIIKDESADIDKNADKADQRSKSGGSAAPDNHPLNNPNPFAPPVDVLMGASYAPVSAGGGRSYVDRSTHTYQISAGAGLGTQDTSRQIRAELEARDRARAAQQRSRMDND